MCRVVYFLCLWALCAQCILDNYPHKEDTESQKSTFVSRAGQNLTNSSPSQITPWKRPDLLVETLESRQKHRSEGSQRESVLAPGAKQKAKGPRALLQADESDEEGDSDVVCALQNRQIAQYLDEGARTWRIDDDGLAELENDLQAVVNCTQEGDFVLFDVSEAIRPTRRVTIPWRLTISAETSSVELVDGVFPRRRRRTTFNCPDQNEGVFLIRSRGVLLANLEFEGCSFDDPDGSGGIVEVQQCSARRIRDTVQLHHVRFRENRLITAAGLNMNSPSCSAIEMIDVRFRNNTCNGICGAFLSRDNTLREITIQGIIVARPRNNDMPAILYSPAGSQTTASEITATGNQGNVLRVENGTLALSSSTFSGNDANITRGDDPFSACVYLVDAEATIEDATFEDNRADFGSAIIAAQSDVVLNNSIFTGNVAEFGGAVRVENSTIFINSCSFSSNRASSVGGGIHAIESEVVGFNLIFNGNVADDEGGCLWLGPSGILDIAVSSFLQNSAGRLGGVSVLAEDSNGRLTNCVLDSNSANFGGSVYSESSELIVDGCRVTGGNAGFGAAFTTIEGTLTIRNTACQNGSATSGGCIAASESLLQIHNVSMRFNAATESGGAVYLSAGSLTLVNDSELIQNAAAVSGGAIYAQDTDLVVMDAFLSSNAAENGGGIACMNQSTLVASNASLLQNSASFGGAIALQDQSSGNLTDCVVIGNGAVISGSAVFVAQSDLVIDQSQFAQGNAEFGGFLFASIANLSVTNSDLNNGTAIQGGCIRSTSSLVRVENVSMTSSQAQEAGGAVHVEQSQLSLLNCTLSANSAGSRGGGAYCRASICLFEGVSLSNNTAEDEGGGIYAGTDGVLAMTDSVLIQNRADFGGAVLSHINMTGIMTNCIFQNNTAANSGGAVYVGASRFSINACVFIRTMATLGGSVFAIETQLNISNSVCRNGVAQTGGCLNCQDATQLQMENMTMEGASAIDGGALYLEGSSEAILTNITFASNTASQSGAAIYLSASQLTGSRLTINNNPANFGGGLYALASSNVQISDSEFTDNSAVYAGACMLVSNSTGNFTDSVFTRNTASRQGGALYTDSGRVVLEGGQFTENSARRGGSLFVIGSASASVSNCEFVNGTARLGGGSFDIWIGGSLSLQNVSVIDGQARNGGAIALQQSSSLNAARLQISNCSARADGGGIIARSASTILCARCVFEDNTAGGRGGAVSVESNETQLLAVQFERTTFHRNRAEYGGGLYFISTSPMRNCLQPGAQCTFIAMQDVVFTNNRASSAGGAVFSSDLAIFRVRCSTEQRGNRRTFYIREEWESMDVLNSFTAVCPTWTNNRGDGYGNVIASYAADVRKLVRYERIGEEVEARGNRHVVRNHESGEPLPAILLEAIDELGQGPAIGLTNDTIEATMSSPDELFAGSVTITMTGGSGVFAGIAVFQPSGAYDVQITFSEDTIEPLLLVVRIRECVIGQAVAANGLFCQTCSGQTYNFFPQETSTCRPCPDDANCDSAVIRPAKGYWHPSPCSANLQRCLTERACDFDERDQLLSEIGSDMQTCDFDEAFIEKYSNAQCRRGHHGPLCGACRPTFGKSPCLDCRKCLPEVASVVLVAVSVLILIGLSSVTVRSNLGSLMSESRKAISALSQRQEPSGSQPLNVNMEMMEMWFTGQVPPEILRPSRSRSFGNFEQTAKDAELAKWKAFELFKITLNYVQITALAVSIDVDWSLIIVAMFEVADFLGGVISESTSRLIDCLVSHDHSVPRSVVTTLVVAAVPVVVMVVFLMFWTGTKIRHKEDSIYLWKRFVLSVVAIFYVSYISITHTLVNILNCIEVHDSTSIQFDSTNDYWAVDTSVRCYEGSHAALAGLLGWPFLVLFSFGFPVIIAYAIAKKIREDFREGWIYDVAGFMYRSYTPKYVFWESLIMLRKAALAVVVVFSYPLGGSLQCVLAVFVLVVASYLQILCRPYRKEFEILNEMESVSLLVSLLTFVSSLFFDSDRVNDGVRAFITAVIVLCNLSIFLTFIAFLFIFSAEYLRLILDAKKVLYDPNLGILHVFKVYYVDYIGTIVREKIAGVIRQIIYRNPSYRSSLNP